MNRHYSLVWNCALRVLQVASELATTRGGGTSGGCGFLRRRTVAAACALILGFALATPGFAQQATSGGGSSDVSAWHYGVPNPYGRLTISYDQLTNTLTIDPQDFTIAPTGGDITGALLDTELATGNVAILSSGGGTAGTGDINVNDAVSWNANTLTLTAANNIVISSTGSMTVSGSGGLVLNPGTTNGSDSAAPGGTTIISSGGALTLGGTGTLTLSPGIVDNGALTFQRGVSTTYGGVISGLGTLTKAGSGTLTLAGTNTYSGSTTINGGTLVVSSDANLGSGGGLTLNGGTLENSASFTLNRTVTLGNGGGVLQVDSGTDLTLAQAVTGTGNFTQVGGGTLTLDANIVNGGSQTYTDPVTLGADVTTASTGNGDIDFVSTVDGGHALTVNTAGVTTFGGAVGGTSALTSLTTNASGSTTLGGNVTTTGAQTYAGAVTLAGDVTAASTGSGNVGFSGTVDGAHALTVNTAGVTTFGGAVGGTTALTSLTTDASGGTVLGGNVTTTGDQIYNDAVTLAGDVTVVSSGGGNVDFSTTVDGAHALTVNTAGVTTFGGTVGGTTALTSLTTDASGSTVLGGNVTTTSNQIYNDAVTLAGDVTAVSSGGGNVGFSAMVDGAYDLVVSTGGAVNFGGAVGGTTALTSLTTNASGSTTLGGNVTTTGAQTYTDAVTLGGAVTLTGTTVTLNAVTGNGNDLGITGNAVLNGAASVNGLTVSGSLAFNTGGSVSGNVTAGALDYSGYGSAVSFAFTSATTGATSGVTGTWSGVGSVVGSASGSDAITGLGSTAFNLTGANAGKANSITFSNFETADTTTVTGAVGFDDTARSSEGMTFANATSVAGSGTIGNVTGAFADDTRQSAVSGIIYGAGFSAVTGTGGNVTGVTGDFDVGTKKSSASGLDYSGFNLGVVSGSGAGATITGGNLTYTLDNSVADKGSSNGVTWTSFGNINDATGTVNFGTAGALTGNVTAATLDYSGYGSAVSFDLSDGSGATTGVGGTWTGVTSVTGSGNTDTIKGINQTYTLTGVGAGGNGTVNWSAFEQIADSGVGTLKGTGQTYTLTGSNAGTVATWLPGGFSGIGTIADATGTVNFGTAGALTGNVTAATLDYSGYGGLANVNLSGTGTTGVGGSVSGVSAIVASSNLAVSGTTGGPLSITETGAGTTTTLGSGVSSLTVGGTITLTAAGMVNEGAAGVVKASTLTGSSVGATTLNGANQIASLGNFSANGFSLTNATPLAITGTLASGTVALDDSNGIVVSGAVNAATTAIAPGTTLQIGDGNGNGSISGDVVDGGTLAFDIGSASSNGYSTLAYGGVISGPGMLRAINTSAAAGNFGILSVSGQNTFTGGAEIGGATSGETGSVSVYATNVNALGTGMVTVNKPGELWVSGSGNTDAFGNTLDNAGYFNFQNLTLEGQTITNGAMPAFMDFSTGSSAGNANIANAGLLSFDNDASTGTATIRNSGSLDFGGTATAAGATIVNTGDVGIDTTLTGNLAIGSLSGSGTVHLGSGTLILGGLNHDDTISGSISDGLLTPGGSLAKTGTGTLTLDGQNTYTGGTEVQAGTLIVGSAAGNGASVAGNVNVDAGATLGGHGSIGGNIAVSSGGIVAPGDSIGTLTVNGDFTAAQGSVLDYEFGAPAASPSAFTTFGAGDSVHLGGNLELDGATLNVTDAGGMGPGLYNLFTYGGTLTEANGGFALNNTTGQTLQVQNLTAQKQINLIDTTGLTLDFWNANGRASATQMGGGSGTWSVTAPVWTDATGSVPNLAMQPQPGFAIFGGTPGTVTVDDSSGNVTVTGMQFVVDGYTLTGGTLTLVGSGGAAPIRVGDGSAAGAGMTATIDNVIAGVGGLVKSGSGTLMLTGANTYSGGTTISAGMLQVGNGGTAGAITGDVADNGVLVFNRSDAVTFAGVVSGSGSLAQAGSGALTLNGDSGAFAGMTTVRSGTLVVGDDSHAGAALGGMVTVAQGATLGGTGTLGGLDLAGTLAPGGSIGTLHVSGNATFEQGSVFDVEASPGGTADQLAVDGAVTIKDGSVFAIAQAGNWAPRTTYTIITAGKRVTGTFGSVSDNLAFLTPVLGYSANAVELTLERNDINFADVALTPNEKGAATGAGGLDFGNLLYDALVKLDGPTAQAAFTQLSGEYHASQQTARVNDSRYVREAMEQRLRQGDADADAAKLGDTRLDAWAHAWGHWGTTDSDGNAGKLADNGDGLLIGADLPVGARGRIGVAGGASRNSLSVGERASWGKLTSQWLGAFGGITQGALALRGGVAYAWDQIPTNREVDFPGYSDRLSGNASGNTLTGFVEGAWKFELARGDIEPFLNLAHTRVETDRSTEAGGPAALRVEAGSVNISFGTVGARGSVAIAHHLDLHGELGWQHAFGDTTPERTLQLVAGGPAFTEYGAPIAKNAGLGKIGLDWHAGRVTIDADYEGLSGGGVKDQAAKLSVSVAF